MAREDRHHFRGERRRLADQCFEFRKMQQFFGSLSVQSQLSEYQSGQVRKLCGEEIQQFLRLWGVDLLNADMPELFQVRQHPQRCHITSRELEVFQMRLSRHRL